MRYYCYPERIPVSWWLEVGIPLEELPLTDEDYRKAIRSFETITIQLHFIFTARDREVGILTNDVSYDGEWALPAVGNYPGYIMKAVNDYMCQIDVDAVYGDKVVEKINHYIDSIYETQ